VLGRSAHAPRDIEARELAALIDRAIAIEATAAVAPPVPEGDRRE